MAGDEKESHHTYNGWVTIVSSMIAICIVVTVVCISEAYNPTFPEVQTSCEACLEKMAPNIVLNRRLLRNTSPYIGENPCRVCIANLRSELDKHDTGLIDLCAAADGDG